MARRPMLASCTLIVCAALAPARAQEIRIKLGTLAPQGSTWHNLLVEMGDKWAAIPGSKVKLVVYAGGTQGNEGDMITKMGTGQLSAAAVTALGLREISPEPQAECLPGLIDSEAEYEYVHAKFRPELDQALLEKGYVVLNWGEVGFARFFSVQPYKSPSEFAKGKLFVWNGDPASEKAWKQAGFQTVALSASDIYASLQTGMIDTFAQAPLYAYAANLYSKAKYMLDLKFGFLTGATIISVKAWAKIPPDVRTQMLAIAAEIGAKVVADVRTQNAEALEQMKAKGLVVTAPEDLAAWKKVFDGVQDSVRGKVVPAAAYDRVKALRDEFRAGGGAAAPPAPAAPEAKPAPEVKPTPEAPKAEPAPAQPKPAPAPQGIAKGAAKGGAKGAAKGGTKGAAKKAEDKPAEKK